MTYSFVARIAEQVVGPESIHYEGPPPEFTGGVDVRKPMPRAAIVAISELPDGIFLFRFSRIGQVVGDTWHMTIEDAKHQAWHEYGDLLSDWTTVTEDVEDIVVFGLQL